MALALALALARVSNIRFALRAEVKELKMEMNGDDPMDRERRVDDQHWNNSRKSGRYDRHGNVQNSILPFDPDGNADQGFVGRREGGGGNSISQTVSWSLVLGGWLRVHPPVPPCPCSTLDPSP